MRIIIAGAGEVGYYLAKMLAQEKQDIVLIDIDADRLKYVSNHLDVTAIRGNSTSYKTLKEAEISKADLLIAATSSEETNLATAVIGKHLGAKKTVARISNVEFLLNREVLELRDIGIDEIISPESLAAREIKRLLREAALTDSFDFDGGSLSLIGLNIDQNCELRDKTVEETVHLNPDESFIPVAVLRNNKTIIPRGDTKFELNDHAYFIVQPNGIDRVLSLANKKRIEIKNVMILGGSRAGYNTARRLSKKYNVRLIDMDMKKCLELAESLPDTLIIHGDGRNVELLKEEGLDTMDAFIALTGNSEVNIISCLIAKNHGVKKTISLVENIDYIHLSQEMGVDTMINKKLIAASFIFRYIRQGQVVSLTSIHGVDGEILEFIVNEKSKITNKTLKEVNFPKSAIVGGVIRDKVGYTTWGEFTFRTNDRAVVFCLPESIHAVEKIFK